VIVVLLRALLLIHISADPNGDQQLGERERERESASARERESTRISSLSLMLAA
jgi:hypothetical protein